MKKLHFTQATKGEGHFIRQQGPPGRYGHVILLVEPFASKEIEFSWEAQANQIPKEFEQSVQAGVLRLFESGAPLEGWSSSDLKVRIIGGSSHETDSNEVSYVMAAAMAFQQAVKISRATSAA